MPVVESCPGCEATEGMIDKDDPGRAHKRVKLMPFVDDDPEADVSPLHPQ